MLIQCTKKLLDELKIMPDAVVDETLPLFSWHANLITVNRRKTVVLVNDSNRYIVVLHGLKAKDFQNLDDFIRKAIRETLLAEDLAPDIVEKVIQFQPEIKYTKTKNRTATARLSKACETVGVFAEDFNVNVITQPEVSLLASRHLVSAGKDYIFPNEEMYKDMEAFVKTPIFECEAVQIKVTLDLYEFEVWRILVIPTNITFNKLHKILQIAFEWKDYHMHDFCVFDGETPIINLVCSEEIFEYQTDLPMKMESDHTLSDFVPKYERIKYCYDFGDMWQHYIEVEKVIENYSNHYPICLEGIGNSPPEDVGGEEGYEDFLEAISNPTHEEHEFSLEWGKMQGYSEFNIEEINKKLKLLNKEVLSNNERRNVALFLKEDDAKLFFKLWLGVLSYTNQKYKLNPKLGEMKTQKGLDVESLISIKDKLWEDVSLLDEYIKTNELLLPDREIKILSSWKEKIAGKFVVLKNLKKYSVFLSVEEEQKLYGVVGISNPIEEILPSYVLPSYVEAVLLPFEGKIIYDSLLRPYDVQLGSGIQKNINEQYKELKKQKGIITSL